MNAKPFHGDADYPNMITQAGRTGVFKDSGLTPE